MACELTLALAQCAHPENGDVLGQVEHWMRRARERHADMVVFPECLMTPYELSADEFAASAQPLDGAFARAVDVLARELGLWAIYTVNEKNPHGAKPFNTAIITDSSGTQRGFCRKVHLFDVGDYRESDKMSAGDAIFEPVETPFGKIGLGICYDLRFPELARAQALQGCDVLVYPSAWVAGERKVEQWRTLLAARAIENELFVAGCTRTGGKYAGYSAVFGPKGEVLASAEDDEALLIAHIDTAACLDVRAQVPVFEHREPDVY